MSETSGIDTTPRVTTESAHALVSPRISSFRVPQSSEIRREGLVTSLARLLARGDYAAVQAALNFLPLKFRNRQDETDFFSRILPTHLVRIDVAMIVSIIVYTIFWITAGLSIKHEIYPLGGRYSFEFFHGMMAIMCFMAILFRMINRIKYFQGHVESAFYVFIIISLTLPLVWALYSVINFPNESPLDNFSLHDFKLWTTPLRLGLPLGNLVLLNLLMQTRTRRSFIPQLIFLFIYLCMSVSISVWLLMSQEKSEIVVLNAVYYYLILTVLEVVSLTFVFLVSYLGRWNEELRERIEFYKLTKSIAQLTQLKAQLKRRRMKSGSTAVEDLLDVVTRAMAAIQESEVTTGSKVLIESTEILRQIHDILTNTDNLYAVRLQEPVIHDDKSANEEALIEAQFYQIYANRGPQLPFGKGQNLPAASQLPEHSGYKIKNFAPPPKASAEFRRALGREWSCNILKAAEEYPNIVVETAALLLEPRSSDLKTSPICMRNYAHRIERLYRANPYHNSAHAAMVGHAMSCLIRMLDIHQSSQFSSLDFSLAIIAALGHDAGHPGRNNQFYISGFHRMALIYNDKSVLENYHTALVFKSMEPISCNIFEGLSPEICRSSRRKIIDLILATDMGSHFEAVSKFRLRRQAAGFNFLTDSEDLWLVLRICIKCADLSHAVVDWNQHQGWSLRVAEEFYQQGEEETLIGLPMSPLCDRSTHVDFAKSQKGFIEFVVQPLFYQMDEMDHHERIADNCLKHLTYNKYKWEEMARDKKTIDIPESVHTSRTDSDACRILLLHLFVPKSHKLVPLTGGESKRESYSRRMAFSQNIDAEEGEDGVSEEYYDYEEGEEEEEEDDELDSADYYDEEEIAEDEGQEEYDGEGEYQEHEEFEEKVQEEYEEEYPLEEEQEEEEEGDYMSYENEVEEEEEEYGYYEDNEEIPHETQPGIDNQYEPFGKTSNSEYSEKTTANVPYAAMKFSGKGRSSTLETARFGSTSSLDFDEDQPENDYEETAVAGEQSTSTAPAAFWDEDEDPGTNNDYSHHLQTADYGEAETFEPDLVSTNISSTEKSGHSTAKTSDDTGTSVRSNPVGLPITPTRSNSTFGRLIESSYH